MNTIHNPDTENPAKSVVLAFEHGRHGIGGLKCLEHAAAVAELMRRLLRIMPTDDSAVLAVAFNRVLADIPNVMGLIGPRVEAIDLNDGSATMRPTWEGATRLR